VQAQQRGFEPWVRTGQQELVRLMGEIISVEEFERRYPDAIDLCADAEEKERENMASMSISFPQRSVETSETCCS
jgi:hypothetical protein